MSEDKKEQEKPFDLEGAIKNAVEMFRGADTNPIKLAEVIYGILDMIRALSSAGALAKDAQQKQWYLVQINKLMDQNYKTTDEGDRNPSKIVHIHK